MRFHDNHSSEVYELLRQGDAVAQAQVWEEHYPTLVRVARQRLRGVPRRAFDEEDVVLDALHSFFNAVRAGSIYPWRTVSELFRLLLTITRRKAFAFRLHETREKRGGGRVRGDSVFVIPPGNDPDMVADRHEPADYRPSPRAECSHAEDEQRLLDILPRESLRQIARLRLARHTNDEIAELLGCTRRTVERKVQQIRAALAETSGFGEVARQSLPRI